MLEPTTSSAHLDRFLAIDAVFEDGRGVFESAMALRFAALVSVPVASDPSTLVEEVRAVAANLHDLSSSFGPLRTDLRWLMAALLRVHCEDAEPFMAEVDRVRELFRGEKLRRDAGYEILSTYLLRRRFGSPIPEAAVARFHAVYEELKRYHWWLTGPDDFPACALLTGANGDPEEIGRGIETIYEALRETGLQSGDSLQTTAHLLYLAETGPSGAARCAALREAFEAREVEIGADELAEVALLAAVDGPPERVAARVLELGDVLYARLQPPPGAPQLFGLAAGLALYGAFEGNAGTSGLLDVQAALHVQQVAAAVGVIAG